MGKGKKQSNDMLSSPTFWSIAIISAIAVVVLTVCLITGIADNPAPDVTTSATTTVSTPNQEVNSDSVMLDKGLVITEMSKFSGQYMEDGSNESVTDVMMLVVKNTNVQDLQLARIDVAYSEFTASFQITNLPAGESVVVLEKNRQKYVDEKYTDIQAKDVVFFKEAMSLRKDKFEVSGELGGFILKNISDTDVTGDIYVYYKNAASDLYYGGITYRAKCSDGLKVGESKRIPAGHYSPESCEILMVAFGE